MKRGGGFDRTKHFKSGNHIYSIFSRSCTDFSTGYHGQSEATKEQLLEMKVPYSDDFTATAS